MQRFSRYQLATATALFFHAVGLFGILFTNNSFFVKATPLNLLLSFALLVFTQENKNRYFWSFLLTCLITGFAVEYIGVNSGWLFGEYAYGTVLGPAWKGVPFMIGVNWFIIVYCCGTATTTLMNRLAEKFRDNGAREPTKLLRAASVVVDGATLAVLFDWLMEPVAIKLGFWAWKGDGSIPVYNYICWFAISALLMLLFHTAPFPKPNKFALHLLLIQAMFFLLLHTFLA